MKKVYLYKKCSRCSQSKEENRSPYCRRCKREYAKLYNLNKTLQPNINIVGLGEFIQKVKKQRNWITHQDMLTIMFFYEIITTNINEYDNLNPQHQYYYMWQTILEFYKRKTEPQ